MQYQARILNHSSLGNCFRRYHRSYKCHLCRNLAVHIRHRMSAGSYPGGDKTGNIAVLFAPISTSENFNLSSNLISSPTVSLTAVFVSSRNAYGG